MSNGEIGSNTWRIQEGCLLVDIPKPSYSTDPRTGRRFVKDCLFKELEADSDSKEQKEVTRAKGTGTVKKIGSKFYARWRIEGKDVYGNARDTQDEAEQDRISSKPKDITNHITNRQMPTVAEFARMCMNEDDPTFGWYGRSLKDSSYDTNATHLETHLVGSKLGNLKLKVATSLDVEQWVNGIQAKKWAKKGGVMTEYRTPASAAYKRRCHGFVRKVFNVAIKHKILNVNPASGIELPKVVTRRNVLLTDEQLSKLYDGTSRTASLCIVAVETGLRRQELTELTWDHVTDDGLIVTNHKNQDQEDCVPLTSTARAVIERQPKNGAYVFSTADGKQLTTRNLNRDVRALYDSLGFPKGTRLHDLRGKFTSDLISAGTDIKTTQVLARHQDPATTLKYYVRVSEEQKNEAMAKLAARRGNLDGAVNGGSGRVAQDSSG